MGVYADIIEELEIEFETKYLGNKLFEITWKERKYEIQMIRQGGRFWIDLPPSDLFLDKVKKELIEDIMKISVSKISLLTVFSSYLAKRYKQTMDYKMENIYN